MAEISLRHSGQILNHLLDRYGRQTLLHAERSVREEVLQKISHIIQTQHVDFYTARVLLGQEIRQQHATGEYDSPRHHTAVALAEAEGISAEEQVEIFLTRLERDVDTAQRLPDYVTRPTERSRRILRQAEEDRDAFLECIRRPQTEKE